MLNEYEPEETSSTKYNIILCELYNKFIHGPTTNEGVKYHRLVICRFKLFDIDYINDAVFDYSERYEEMVEENHIAIRKHHIYKNYRQIVSNENYIQPEIAQCIYLPTNECISILKTFWIKIIQRKWKKVLEERKEIIKKRRNPFYIKYREIYGKWPKECFWYPTIIGMLSDMAK